jgi:hypothetical protein
VAAELTITTVLELVERPASYSVTVKRGDRMLQVTLTPRHMV